MGLNSAFKGLMLDSEEDETRLPVRNECVASNSGSETNIGFLFKSGDKWVDMLLISIL